MAHDIGTKSVTTGDDIWNHFTRTRKAVFFIVNRVVFCIWLFATSATCKEPLTVDNWDSFFKAQVEAGNVICPPVLRFDNPRIGQIGFIDGYFEVFQKQNQTEVLVTTTGHSAVGLDVSSAELRYTKTTLGPFLFRGFEQTKDLADGSKVFFNKSARLLVEVTGTFSYTTTAGAKATVMVVEPSKRSVPESPAFIGLEKRKWSDKTGKFQIEATYAGFEKGNVKLTKADGTSLAVPQTSLCEADVTYVRELVKENANYIRNEIEHCECNKNENERDLILVS